MTGRKYSSFFLEKNTVEKERERKVYDERLLRNYSRMAVVVLWLVALFVRGRKGGKECLRIDRLCFGKERKQLKCASRNLNFRLSTVVEPSSSSRMKPSSEKPYQSSRRASNRLRQLAVMSLYLASEARKISQQKNVASGQENEVSSLSSAHDMFT